MRTKSVAIRVLTPVMNQRGEVEMQLEQRYVRLPLSREDRRALVNRLKA